MIRHHMIGLQELCAPSAKSDVATPEIENEPPHTGPGMTGRQNDGMTLSLSSRRRAASFERMTVTTAAKETLRGETYRGHASLGL